MGLSDVLLGWLLKPVLDQQKKSEEHIMATLQELQTAISNLDQAADQIIAKLNAGAVGQAEIDALNSITGKITAAITPTNP